MKLKMKWKTARRLLLLAVFISILLIVLADLIITWQSKKYISGDINQVPQKKTGLILGCSKYLSGNRANLYFDYRINAAVELYRLGKVQTFVISGDNSRPDYNEPQNMKDELVRNGIPDSIIYLDYAGFRTLDSVIRMDKIFGQKSFTIISQKFHNQRAVFIARQYGLNTYGYNAQDVDKYTGFKTKTREKFARVKVFIDILTHRKPKFLGETIEIK